MDTAKNKLEKETGIKLLTPSEVKLANDKFKQLLRKKPDLLKDGPLKMIEWVESLIKFYKSYE